MNNISYKTLSILTLLLIVGCNNSSTVDTESKVATESNIQKKPQVEAQTERKMKNENEWKVIPKLKDENEQVISNKITLNCEQVDEELAKNLKISFENSDYNWDGSQPRDFEAFKKSNSIIEDTLMSYAKTSKSVDCNFPLASQEGLSVQTSDDKKFRAFSWDENTGGSMHDYVGFYQFRDNQGNLHLEDKNNSSVKNPQQSLPSALFMEILNGQATYILVSTSVYSNKDQSQLLQTFTINGDKTQSAKVIRTNSGLTNRIHFEYDFFSVVVRPERPIQMFEYDKKSKTIRFPIVVADPDYPSGKVTNKFIEYQFDGEYFQRVKK